MRFRHLWTGFAAAVVALALALPAMAETVKLRVGYVPNTDYLPLFVARDRGLFEKLGLDVALTRIQLAPNVPAVLIAGDLDIGMANGPLFLQTADNDLGLIVISGLTRHLAANPAVSLMARKGVTIATAQDLVGKTVGVPGFGATFEIMFRKWLRARDVPLDRVKLVEATLQQMHDLLKAGTIDGALALEPFRARIVGDGAGYRAIDFLGEVNPSLAGAIWIATRDWTEKHADAIGAFRQALAEGIAYIGENRQDAEAIEKKYLNFVAPELPNYQLDVSAGDLAFFAGVMREFGMLRQPIDVATLLAPSAGGK